MAVIGGKFDQLCIYRLKGNAGEIWEVREAWNSDVPAPLTKNSVAELHISRPNLQKGLAVEMGCYQEACRPFPTMHFICEHRIPYDKAWALYDVRWQMNHIPFFVHHGSPSRFLNKQVDPLRSI